MLGSVGGICERLGRLRQHRDDTDFRSFLDSECRRRRRRESDQEVVQKIEYASEQLVLKLTSSCVIVRFRCVQRKNPPTDI